MTEREILKGRKEQLLADDAGWITGEVPERNGWYDCKVRRRNPKYVLDPEHEPEYIYDLASCLSTSPRALRMIWSRRNTRCLRRTAVRSGMT